MGTQRVCLIGSLVLAGLTMIAIVAGSFTPDRGAGETGLSAYSNYLHVPAYLLLMLLLTFASRLSGRWHWLQVVLLVTALSAVIELLQPLAGRMASVQDFALNIIGVAAGLISGVLAARHFRVRAYGSHARH